MRGPVKRAWCFWCDQQLFWSTWRYVWYTGDGEHRCDHPSSKGQHRASETRVSA